MKPCELAAALAKLPFVDSAKWYPADASELAGYALKSPVRMEYAEYFGAVVATTAQGFRFRIEYFPRHGPLPPDRVLQDGVEAARALAGSMAEVALGLRALPPR